MNLNHTYWLGFKMPRRTRRKNQKKKTKEWYAERGVYVEDNNETDEEKEEQVYCRQHNSQK